jgi:hypothetical protein
MGNSRTLKKRRRRIRNAEERDKHREEQIKKIAICILFTLAYVIVAEFIMLCAMLNGETH